MLDSGAAIVVWCAICNHPLSLALSEKMAACIHASLRGLDQRLLVNWLGLPVMQVNVFTGKVDVGKFLLPGSANYWQNW